MKSRIGFSTVVTFISIMAGLRPGGVTVTNEAEAKNSSSFFDLTTNGIDGKPVELSKYKGKAVLVVNVASKCGFTHQYDGLETVYKKHKDKGLVVLGFPSNDFGSQEPGTNQEIQDFCKINFGVSFPLFAKAPVKGSDKQPVFRFLTESGPKEVQGEVGWNFEKFLISPSGQVVGRWKSVVAPESGEIRKAIEAQLAKVEKGAP